MKGNKPVPVHREKIGIRSIWRIPDDGYVTPRLREERTNTSAIGFHVNYREAEDEE
jgi:hypothetical protein